MLLHSRLITYMVLGVGYPSQPTGIRNLTLVDASLAYHNVKLDEQSSYLTTFSCQFGRYRYIWLPSGVAPAGDMLQKIDELFCGISNVFGIADDILITGLLN